MLSEDAFGSASLGVIPLSGQGASFVAAGAAFVVDIVVSVVGHQVTAAEAGGGARRAGLLRDAEGAAHRPGGAPLPWYRSPTKLAGISLVMVTALNIIFR